MSAVLYFQGKEWGHLEHTLRDQVTQIDMETNSLHPALTLLSSFLATTHSIGTACFFTRSEAAVKHFLNLGQHPQQHLAVEYVNTINNILTAHPDLTLAIHHNNQATCHISFKQMHHLLLDNIKQHITDDNSSQMSLDFQKKESKASVLQEWEQCFFNSPCSSQIYDSILMNPPDGKLPMILQVTSTGYHANDQTYKHHVPRDIQSTLF